MSCLIRGGHIGQHASESGPVSPSRGVRGGGSRRPVGRSLAAGLRPVPAAARLEPDRGEHRPVEQPEAERFPALLLLRFVPRAPPRLAGRGGDAALGRAAPVDGDQFAGEVARYFSLFPPLTAGGHAQHAFALQGSGRSDEARAAARRAWTGGVLPLADEQRLIGAFGGSFSAEDHRLRMEVLLGNGDGQSAARTLMWAPAEKRALYEARIALQARAPDAASRLDMLDGAARRDAGLIVDQAIWLRNTGQSAAARQMLAGSAFDRPPVGVARGRHPLAPRAAPPRHPVVDRLMHSSIWRGYPPGRVSARPYGEPKTIPPGWRAARRL